MLLRTIAGACLAVFLLTAWLAPAQTPAAGQPGVKEFRIYATDGWVTMPDGARVYIWGFSDKDQKGSATLPGPSIRVNQGDRVRITLTNIGLAEQSGAQPNHTIHLHGLDVDQANDGVGHTSHEVPYGQSQTYEFTADYAGTYWYHCHVDPTEHIQMGMYGAIVVMPPGGQKRAYPGGPAFDREVTLVLSEIDPTWHQSVYDRKPYDRTEYRPRYWVINGKAAPELMSDIGSVVQGEVGERILVRLINAGYQWHAMHMHGFHFDVIASDGRPLPAPWSKDTLSIGPAERYDLLVTLNQKGAYPFHDHNEIAVTNNGASGGGMHTMVYAGQPIPAPQAHAEEHHHAESVGETNVTMRASLFQPSVVNVRAGQKVSWVNQDLTAHNINGNGWSSGTVGYGQQYSRTFDQPGTYDIWCSLHATMVGQVVVARQ